METIILAAGKGNRMGRITSFIPKPILPVGDTTILSRLVNQVSRYTKDITVVVGYEKQKVIDELKRFEFLKIVENNDYDKDVNILSLTKAFRNSIPPVCIFEADALFTDASIKRIYDRDDKSYWFTGGNFKYNQTGCIMLASYVGKIIDLKLVDKYYNIYDAYKKYIGVLKVGSEQFEKYRDHLYNYCSESTNQYYINPWMDNLMELECYEYDLGPRGTAPFNTSKDYHAAIKRFERIMSVDLVDVSRLRPIEGHSKKRVVNIKNKILKEDIWTRPICIEKNYMLVLDGMHRLEISKELGFKVVPCLSFNYEDVDVWSLRKTHKVSRELVIEKALSNDIYPYKTAKHKFPVNIVNCDIPLERLYHED